MEQYIHTTIDRLALPTDGKHTLHRACTRLFETAPAWLPQAAHTYYETDFAPVSLPDNTDLSPWEQGLLLMLASARHLEDAYTARGYAPWMFDGFLRDVSAKTDESHRWHGVWGISPDSGWYPLFFRLKLFSFGRLQCERYILPDHYTDVTVGGHTVKAGDTVYYIHIPGIGPMTEELCYESYRRAYDFFQEELNERPCVFYCSSWLLYQCNREFMAPTSNILRFMDDFKIVHSGEAPAQTYRWVFDVPYEGDASVLPRDTTLRRRLAQWLEHGGKPGNGEGFFLFDGKQIIND